MEQALYDRPDVYDALYARKDYEHEVAFTLDRFDEHGNDGDRALVVGCATGQHSAVLRERGFAVIGMTRTRPCSTGRANGRTRPSWRADSWNCNCTSTLPTPRSISCGFPTPFSTTSVPTNWSRHSTR